jgi:hypothetical protein
LFALTLYFQGNYPEFFRLEKSVGDGKLREILNDISMEDKDQCNFEILGVLKETQKINFH